MRAAFDSVRLGMIFLPAPLAQPAESIECASSSAGDASLRELFARLGGNPLVALPANDGLPAGVEALVQVQLARLIEELEGEAAQLLAEIELA